MKFPSLIMCMLIPKPSVVKCICYVIIVCLFPIILLCHSIFSTYPMLCQLNKALYNMHKLKNLFYISFAYLYITLYFTYHTVYYSMKLLVKYSILLNFFLELCVSFDLIFVQHLLILCGDVETNPGPNTSCSQSLSICHWNVNGLSAHNYLKLSLLEA